MSMYRMCLVGTLMMLGGCSAVPTQHAAQSAPATAAPVMPSATVVAPSAPASAPPAVAPEPAPMAMAEPAAAPVPPVPPVPEVAPPPPATHRMAHKAPALKNADDETAAVPASARVQISGHVDLSAAHGQQVTPGEQADTVVYFVPNDGAARARPGHYTVYTHNRDFNPEAMAVPQGSTVTFVNLDDVRHNVFSVTPGSTFNLGYQGSGEKAAHVFTHAGLVLISCNVHHSMELDMLVVPSPYIAKVAANGSFTLGGLPAGPGTLHFWNPRAQPASQAISLPMGGMVKQVLQVIKPRMTAEMSPGDAP